MYDDAADTVQLKAPIDGIMFPLENVPDPVFSQKMVGDGVSIDPTSNTLVAPCDGTVIDLQGGGHAITLRSSDGLEVLMHIGLETVNLGGAGFEPLVSQGDDVRQGQELIRFDLDKVALRTKSLLTQMVIANGERATDFVPATGMVRAGADVALTFKLVDGVEAGETHDGPAVTSDPIEIVNPQGLHARPTATLVGLAKGFNATISLLRDEDEANAKSIIQIMNMGVKLGQSVRLRATGPDAAAAIAKLGQVLADGLGEEVGGIVHGGGEMLNFEDESARALDDPHIIPGIVASSGIVIGQVVQLRAENTDIPRTGAGIATEFAALKDAMADADGQLVQLESQMRTEGAKNADIFVAHREILEDPGLYEAVENGINAGQSAAWAWNQAIEQMATGLEDSDNKLLTQRGTDVRDVGRRVLGKLLGKGESGREMFANTILVATDLTPSETATLDRTKVVGIVTTGGGVSSHVAILAKAMALPAIVGAHAAVLEIADGTTVILDAEDGTIRVGASEDEIASIRARQAELAARREEAEAHKGRPAVTTDGHQVTVVANIAGEEDAKAVVTAGGEGVGLLRTEFVFMNSASLPSEEDQRRVYAQCATALEGKPLVIRTLDVGGDKPLPYLNMPPEENPFLGMRGIRVGLHMPDLLRTQIRAILSAATDVPGTHFHVMFPMVSTIADWRAAKTIFEGVAGGNRPANVSLGIMVEVPAVAVLARQFAAEDGLDFFSVGTNDLTSYTLAMDRGHTGLAPYVDPYHPSVLTLIKNAADALHSHGKWLGVCGGIASDPLAAPLLVGLGADELSCSTPAIALVKAAIRRTNMDACQELAEKALTARSGAEVRALAEEI